MVSAGALEEDSVSGECKKSTWCHICNKVVGTLVGFRCLKSVIPQTRFLSRFLIWPSPFWSQKASRCQQNHVVFGLHHVPNCQRSISRGYLRGVIAAACSMHSKHETRACSASSVLASFQKTPKQPRCLYILGCELGAMTKEQESWVHHPHQPAGPQNHIYY